MKYLILTLLLVSALPALALAAPGDVSNPQLQLTDTLTDGPNAVLDIINRLIDWAFTLILVFAVAMVLLAAYKYLTAGGDEEKIQSAHGALKWVVVAIGVALLSGGIRFLVESLVLPEEQIQDELPQDSSDIWNTAGGGAA